jgi:crotonobetainyl-CoA:carnitine CoA-transferase CaiB-like acyl-CoA transferase
MANWPAAVAILETGVATLQADDLVARLQSLKCVAGKAVHPFQLIESEHLKARGYWKTVQTAFGSRPALGPPFRMEKTPRRPSPELAPQAGERVG